MKELPNFRRDECVRCDTSLAKVGSLKPAFRDGGAIHAGNSSQISGAAAALMITTSEKAAELGLSSLARLHPGVVTGDDPFMMLTGPLGATSKLLARSGLRINDIEMYELNEAFAPVPLAWLAETGANATRLNPLGGAIVSGHPSALRVQSS